MTALKIPERAWVVVCDGRKALILENKGDAEHPDLRMREVSEHESRPTHAMGADSPGRVHQSLGASRSSVEQTDWHDRDEDAFLASLAARLDQALAAGQTAAVIVVAPPRALGMIRNHYSKTLRGALAGEIDKDLVALPVDEIERRLVGGKKR